jgi:poly(3-hydroxybutyrate) depolymerase
MAGIDQINHSGWNEWAVTNDIIVVHPQAALSWRSLFNCFDMGLGNFPANFPARKGFATNEGIQVNAMKAIVDRLLESRDSSKYDYSLDNDMNDRSDFW